MAKSRKSIVSIDKKIVIDIIEEKKEEEQAEDES